MVDLWQIVADVLIKTLHLSPDASQKQADVHLPGNIIPENPGKLHVR